MSNIQESTKTTNAGASARRPSFAFAWKGPNIGNPEACVCSLRANFAISNFDGFMATKSHGAFACDMEYSKQ